MIRLGYLRLMANEVLFLRQDGESWRLVGPATSGFSLVNDFLGYLADRNYSPRTQRAYGYDLLAFARWLHLEGLTLGEVTIDVLLRFLTACREAVLPGRPGGNVYSIRDGRNAGFAAATVNRRIAAISVMFGYWQMRDPAAPNPVPRGRRARVASAGERGGLLAHVAAPKPRSRLRLREPGDCLEACRERRPARCCAASARGETARSPGGCCCPGCVRRRFSDYRCTTWTSPGAGLV